MARINVPDNEWLDFRVLAMKQKRSVADYLGELVRREIGQQKRLESSVGERAGTGKGEAGAARPARSRVRLSDTNVLSSLPVADTGHVKHR